uniref:NAD(P)/FAD-dependent oxidoreductase n=1 Tax=Desulfobacca acetoxidans TaxID=60893 RepID=A0A7C3V573_9BACT
MTTYLIIGNGAAGNAAAEAIRKYDQDGPIHIFSREKYPFYYVPALPEYLAGEREIHQFTLHDLDWYRKNRIDLHLETEIIRIDSEAKTTVTRAGKEYHYDKLLLATGGYSFLPPIKGADLDGVFTLRTYGDAERIRRKARESRRAVLIGGGLLGLEAGNGLRKAGLQVTVVEVFPRLLPRQMDVPGAAILQKQMEEMGFIFYLGAKTQAIIGEAGRLAVVLESGERLSADLVLVSAGVRPELTLAQALGLEIDKGVKVNDAMETSRPDIYAAGDLIEHRGKFYGIWPACLAQGAVAGAVMAGQDARYEGTVPANTLKVVGIDLMAAGDIDAESRLPSLVSKDEAQKTYRKLVIKDNAIVGTILLGDLRGSKEIQEAIRKKTDLSSLKPDLEKLGFDLSSLSR